MAVERIELEVVLKGEQKIKKLEADIARTAEAARKLRLTNNALLQAEITENKKITAEERQQIRLRRLKAEFAGLAKQETAASLVLEKRQTAEAKKQLALQTKMDKSLEKELNTATRIAEAAKAKTKAALTRAGEDLTKRGFATDAAAGRLEEQRIARQSQLEIAASKKLYAYKKKREDQLWKDILDKREAAQKAEAKNIDMYANKAASATNRSIKAESIAVATVAKQKLNAESKLERVKIKNIERNSRLQIAADKRAHAAKVKRENRWFNDQLKRRAAQRGAGQRGQQGALIGAGFPLLFGGGPGSVIGGGIGGLAGEKFLGKGGGFAGSIALSAVGAQIDKLVSEVTVLGKATTDTTSSIKYLTTNELWLDKATEDLAKRMLELGKVEEAAALAGEQLGIILGQDSVDALNELGKASEGLATSTAILWHQFMGLAAFLVGPVAKALDGVLGNASKASLIENARRQAGSNKKDQAEIDAFLEKYTTEKKRGFTWGSDTYRDFGGVSTAAVQKMIMGLGSTSKYSSTAITGEDRKEQIKLQKELAELNKKRYEQERQIQQVLRGQAALVTSRVSTEQRGLNYVTAKLENQQTLLEAKQGLAIKLNELDMQRAKNAGDTERYYALQRKQAQLIYAQTVLQIKADVRRTQLAALQVRIDYKKLQAAISLKQADGKATKADMVALALQRQAVVLAVQGARIAEQAAAYNIRAAGAIKQMTIEQSRFNAAAARTAKLKAAETRNSFGTSTQSYGSGSEGTTRSSGGSKLGHIGFADGGYVTSPTNALVGEGGESEYVIPSSKMQSAVRRYSAGARGSSVIPGGNDAAAAGGNNASYSTVNNAYVGGGSNQINVTTGPILRMEGQNYVSMGDLQRGMSEAVSAAEANMTSRMRRSFSARRGMG